MSAERRSFSTEHFRPLALLGEEEIRVETSKIPPLYSSCCVTAVVAKEEERGQSELPRNDIE